MQISMNQPVYFNGREDLLAKSTDETRKTILIKKYTYSFNKTSLKKNTIKKMTNHDNICT